jgi:uncharacterized protein YjeT (DUF2065 family)
VDGSDLLTGFALFLIFEGLMPFASPQSWRRAVAQLAELPDGTIRGIGGVIMFAGAGLLLIITG